MGSKKNALARTPKSQRPSRTPSQPSSSSNPSVRHTATALAGSNGVRPRPLGRSGAVRAPEHELDELVAASALCEIRRQAGEAGLPSASVVRDARASRDVDSDSGSEAGLDEESESGEELLEDDEVEFVGEADWDHERDDGGGGYIGSNMGDDGEEGEELLHPDPVADAVFEQVMEPKAKRSRSSKHSGAVQMPTRGQKMASKVLTTSGSEAIPIPLRILCGTNTRDLKLTTHTSWQVAKQKIAEKMELNPVMLRFVYIASWEVKGTKEPPPSFLSDADEWEGLLDRIVQFASSKDKRTMAKPFYIQIRLPGENSSGQSHVNQAKISGQGSSAKKDEKSGDAQESQIGAKTPANDAFRHALQSIKEKWQCEKCDNPCVILAGGKHHPFTIKERMVWANLIVMKEKTQASAEVIPKEIMSQILASAGALSADARQADRQQPADALHAAGSNPAGDGATGVAAASVATGTSAQNGTVVPAPGMYPGGPPTFPPPPYPYPYPGHPNPAFQGHPTLPFYPPTAFQPAALGMSLPTSGYIPAPYPTPYISPGPAPIMPQMLVQDYPSPSRRRARRERYAADAFSDEDPVPPVVVEYPTIDVWLHDLTRDPYRNYDHQDYAQWVYLFQDHGILRLDDLARVGKDRLVDYYQLKEGLAGRLNDWAKEDKERLENAARRRKIPRLGAM